MDDKVDNVCETITAKGVENSGWSKSVGRALFITLGVTEDGVTDDLVDNNGVVAEEEMNEELTDGEFPGVGGKLPLAMMVMEVMTRQLKEKMVAVMMMVVVVMAEVVR